MKVMLPNTADSTEESIAPATVMEWAADNLGNTRNWAQALHRSQKDKNGLPYVTHLDAVAVNLYRAQGFFDLELLQAAYLHDVLEDTPAKSIDLMEAGYTDRTIDAVEAVTKPFGGSNFHYITDIILSGSDAMLVKWADLQHNTEPARLAKLTDVQQLRLKRKYYTAIWRIETCLLRLGLLSERTVTFAQTQEVWKAVTEAKKTPAKAKSFKTAETQYANKWRETTSVGSIFVGDLFSWTEDGTRRKVTGRRPGSNGSVIISLSGLDEEFTIPANSRFWLQFRPFSQSATPPATWHDYMGLPKDYKVTGTEDVTAVEEEWYSPDHGEGDIITDIAAAQEQSL